MRKPIENVFGKAIKVIESCKTLKQIKARDRYIALAQKRLRKMSLRELLAQK